MADCKLYVKMDAVTSLPSESETDILCFEATLHYFVKSVIEKEK